MTSATTNTTALLCYGHSGSGSQKSKVKAYWNFQYV